MRLGGLGRRATQRLIVIQAHTHLRAQFHLAEFLAALAPQVAECLHVALHLRIVPASGTKIAKVQVECRTTTPLPRPPLPPEDVAMSNRGSRMSTPKEHSFKQTLGNVGPER